MSSNVSPDPLAELRDAGWLVMLAGAVSIVAGLLAIAYPDITLLALAVFAGVNMIMLSALSMVEAFAPRSEHTSRTLAALLGVLGLIAGLVILRRPDAWPAGPLRRVAASQGERAGRSRRAGGLTAAGLMLSVPLSVRAAAARARRRGTSARP
jgi:uncharacterized membrane protein HdeD (DUF308 family)